LVIGALNITTPMFYLVRPTPPCYVSSRRHLLNDSASGLNRPVFSSDYFVDIAPKTARNRSESWCIRPNSLMPVCISLCLLLTISADQAWNKRSQPLPMRRRYGSENLLRNRSPAQRRVGSRQLHSDSSWNSLATRDEVSSSTSRALLCLVIAMKMDGR
jgi:hypothetical protein